MSKLQALRMNEKRARLVISLIDAEAFVRFRDGEVKLSGDFTSEQLLALSWWIENGPTTTPEGVL